MGFRSFWVVGNDGDGFVLPSGFAGGVEGSPYDSLLSGGNGGFSQCNGGASATGFGLPDNQCGVAFVFEGEVTVCLFALNKVAEFDGGFFKMDYRSVFQLFFAQLAEIFCDVGCYRKSVVIGIIIIEFQYDGVKDVSIVIFCNGIIRKYQHTPFSRLYGLRKDFGFDVGRGVTGGNGYGFFPSVVKINGVFGDLLDEYFAEADVIGLEFYTRQVGSIEQSRFFWVVGDVSADPELFARILSVGVHVDDVVELFR